jgi:L-aminopeptidase/D-esterase-like protein
MVGGDVRNIPNSFLKQRASGRLAALRSVQKAVTLRSVAKSDAERCTSAKPRLSVAKGVADDELQRVAKLAAEALRRAFRNVVKRCENVAGRVAKVS